MKPSGIYRRKPRQARSRETVEAILEAAERVLSRTGYERFTTNHVAKLGGVSIGSLYQYFPSKQALVAALLDRHVDGSGACITSRLQEFERPSIEQMVRCLVEGMIESHRDDPRLHRVFVEDLPRKGSFVAKTTTRIDQAIARTRRFLEQHASEIAPRNLELAAFIVIHTVDALVHSAVVSRPDLLEGDELGREISALVVRYLKGGAAPSFT